MIENPTDFDRMTELVEIPIDSIKNRIVVSDSLVYIIKTTEGEIIPSQVTYDRKIIFQPQLKANESKLFMIETGELQHFTPKHSDGFFPDIKKASFGKTTV